MAIFSINIFKNPVQQALLPVPDKDVNGFSKDRAFNWTESYEVQQYVARYMQHRGWFSQITSGKLETFIKTRLPFSARTHYDVKIWLDTNFRK